MVKKVSVDKIAEYLARGCKLHPIQQHEFLSHLETLQRSGKLSLLPPYIFQLYHMKLNDKNQQVTRRRKRRKNGLTST